MSWLMGSVQRLCQSSLQGAQSCLQCTLKSKCGLKANTPWCERNWKNMESEALVHQGVQQSLLWLWLVLCCLINSLLITFKAKWSSSRGTSETNLGQHRRDDGSFHLAEPSVKQLSPSEHNIVLSLPFLTTHFLHPFTYFFHFLTCPPITTGSPLCFACFQLDRREAGMKGWRKSFGSRRNGFTPLIHRRQAS